jgi:hypothetical protein
LREQVCWSDAYNLVIIPLWHASRFERFEQPVHDCTDNVMRKYPKYFRHIQRAYFGEEA